MKTLFLSLIAVVATSLVSFAQSPLHEAYLSLADLPGAKAKSDMTIQVNGKADVNQARTVTTTSKSNIEGLRNEFMDVIESLPKDKMVMSANNQNEVATVFAEPGEHNLYNVLILQGDAVTGTFSATFGTSTESDVEAMGTTELSGAHALVITPVAAGSGSFITMTE